MKKITAWIAFSGFFCLWNALVRAQLDPEAARQKLTEEGVLFYQQQKFAEACDRLAAANRIRKDAATVNFEAGCYEKLGRLASAASRFAEAKGLAEREEDPDIALAAAANVTRLESRLAHVTIATRRVDGDVALYLDGILLPRERLGAPIAVDAGRHEIRIEADGRSPVTTVVEIQDGEGKPIVIPPSPGAMPLPEPATPRAGDASELPPARSIVRTAGMVAVAAGLVACGAGVYFGASARSQWSDAKAAGCTSDGTCRDTATLALAQEAASKGTLATAFIVAGIGLGITGALLWTMAPASDAQARRRTTAARVSIGISGTAAVLGGTF